MLTYIKVQYSGGIAYQEIENGHCVRYVDENGDALFTSLDRSGKTIYGAPPGNCRVIDANVVISDEMRAGAVATRRPYDVNAHGDRRRSERRSGR